MTTNYQKGRAFEYKIKKILENRGFIVFRTAGSHGLFDLICFKKTISQNKSSIDQSTSPLNLCLCFYQLKKNISHKVSIRVLEKIINKLDLSEFFDVKDISIRKLAFKNKTFVCEHCFHFIYKTSSEKLIYFDLTFGVIYTPKQKLKNGKNKKNFRKTK